MKSYYVYILAKKENGTLYIGVTNDLRRRTSEHMNEVTDSYSKTYGTKKLVYYEETENVRDAIAREKQLKNWKREWKVRLIESVNPKWLDLTNDLM